MSDLLYLGIDVQARRPSPFAVIDDRGQSIGSGWIKTPSELETIVQRLNTSSRVAIGIDAPRQPLASPREWYWSKTKGWRPRRRSEAGRGRHCEVVIAAYRIANPQWTPLLKHAPTWMRFGFRLFEAAPNVTQLFEVFPSASYALLDADTDTKLEISLAQFAKGPKDMLDAYVAAATVREFLAGRGMAVGGGDGYGQIVLPRPLPHTDSPVLCWPSGKNTA